MRNTFRGPNLSFEYGNNLYLGNHVYVRDSFHSLNGVPYREVLLLFVFP